MRSNAGISFSAVENNHIALAGATYYVLLAGMILVGCFKPFSSTGWTIESKQQLEHQT
jgi:hypothetical protein